MRKLLLMMIVLSYSMHGQTQFQKNDNSFKNFVKKVNQINARYFNRATNTNYQSLVNVTLRFPDTNQTLLEDDTYSYDNFGRDLMSEEITYDTLTGSIDEKNKTEYYYDAQEGWLDYTLSYQYDVSTSQYNLTNKYQVVSYDANLRLPLETVYSYNNAGTWENIEKNIYTYDATGNILTKITQVWNGTWDNSGKDVNTYNSNGQLLLNYFYTWQGSWQLSSQKVLTYDTQQRLADQTISHYQGGVSVNDTKYIFTYNTSGQLITREVQNWDGAQWVDSERVEWTYDADGNVLSEITSDYDNGAWEFSDKLDFTDYTNAFARANLLMPESFDKGEDDVEYFHHQLNHVTASFWDAGAWQIEMNIHLTYQPISVAGIDKVSFADLSVYPNPTTGNLYIDSDKDLTISIFDLSGKQILTNNLLQGNNLIDISQLQSGIYLATIYSNKHSATLKIVKR